MSNFTNIHEKQLDALLAQYQEACGSPEPSRNFMPLLWERIDVKRGRAARLERAAKSMFAAAVGVSLVLGVFLFLPSQQSSAFNSGSFVEELASVNAAGAGTFFEPVRLELNVEQHRR